MAPAEAERTSPTHPWLADLAGLAFVCLVAFCYLSPSLKDGPSLAPADLGTTLSALTTGAVSLSQDCVPPAVPPCAHDDLNGDQVTQAIPWNTVNYDAVHDGEFPWWNSLAGNGLPEFLNFESAPLALPSLVGYLVPLSVSFLVEIAIKLLIAGFGTYLAARLLGCRPLAAALGGSAFMLSGAFAGWLGWSITGTLCWAGFLLSGLILCYRHRGRAGPVVLLAVSVAFAIYGGFVEAYVLLGAVLGLVGLATGLVLVRARRLDLGGVGRVALGGAAGVLLGAPLLLPGVRVLSESVRVGTLSAHGIAPRGLELLFAAGYDGLPIAGSAYFGSSPIFTVRELPGYFESTAYVGVVVLVLAGVGLWCGRRRPAVLGVGAGAVGASLLAYRLPGASPVQRLVIDLHLGAIDLDRVLSLLALCLALLAAQGAEALLSGFERREVRLALGLSAALVALAIAGLGVVALAGLPSEDLTLRRESLYWPIGSLALGVVAFALTASARRGRYWRISPAGAFVGALVVLEGAFLLASGVGINSYASNAFPETAETTAFDHAVGGSLVALDAAPDATCFRQAPGIGYYPNINVGYGVDELALHDPAAPQAYFDSWPIPGAGQRPCVVTQSGATTDVATNLFVPPVDTAALAKRYGAAFVLAGPGLPAPPTGMQLVEHIGTMTLYSVPGSARFSFTSGAGDGVTGSSHPGDASYRVEVRAPSAGRLLALVTDSPGWQATAGGRALAVTKAEGTFLAVAVPKGVSEVSLTYRPPHLGLALALGALGVVILLGCWLLGSWRRRRGERPEAGEMAATEAAGQ